MGGSDAEGSRPGTSKSGKSEKKDKTLIGTFPYPVVKGLPTYESDYGNYGQRPITREQIVQTEEQEMDKTRRRAQTADPSARRKALKKFHTSHMAVPKLKLKAAADGSVIPRPPLSRSTSVDDLGEISFVGPNFNKCSEIRALNFKKGVRLSKCWDNVSTFGSDVWTTTGAEIGSVVKPSVLKQKRAGLISFELLRFLPNHPHWQDRPYKPGQYIKCPKSTYSDLGSYYVDGHKLPPEYQYTLTKKFPSSGSSGGVVM